MERLKARDLFFEFKELGDLNEVYVPSKKNHRGRKYGFTRFYNAKDERALAAKMDSIFLDGKTIHANLPKFKRGYVQPYKVVERKDPRGVYEEVIKPRDKSIVGELSPGRRSGLSYAKETIGALTKSIHLHFAPKEEEVIRFKKSYEGDILIPRDTCEMQGAFYSEDIFYVHVISLGVNLCILEDMADGGIEAFMEGEREWLGNQFKEVRKWSALDVDT